LKHYTAQARYRDKQKQTYPNDKDEYNAYMRQYNADRSKMIRGVKEKLTEQPLVPDAEVLLEMSEAPKHGYCSIISIKTARRKKFEIWFLK
jgi:hypothetical protein